MILLLFCGWESRGATIIPAVDRILAFSDLVTLLRADAEEPDFSFFVKFIGETELITPDSSFWVSDLSLMGWLFIAGFLLLMAFDCDVSRIGLSFELTVPETVPYLDFFFLETALEDAFESANSLFWAAVIELDLLDPVCLASSIIWLMATCISAKLSAAMLGPPAPPALLSRFTELSYCFN